MQVRVVGRIVPERAAQQRILQRSQAAIHSLDLLVEIAGAIGLFMLEIERNPNLTHEHRRATEELRRLLFEPG